jgi:hypothetical protein
MYTITNVRARVHVQVEGKFVRQIFRSLKDSCVDFMGESSQADAVDSVEAVHSWIELASRIVVINGRRKPLILRMAG